MRYSFLLILALASSFLLTAQEAPALTTTADEIVVTGSRKAIAASATAQRVTVIDSAAVAQANDLGQLLNEQAGIVVNGAWSNPGKDRSIFLRNGANQFTLLLIDGQPLLDPSSLSGGAIDLRLLDLSGIERIEILRGGQSVLYGSDAVAGVINLVTRKDDTAPRPFSLHLRAAAQSYNTLETGATLSGGGKKLQYVANLNYFDTDGISEATEPVNSPASFDRDGATRTNASLGITYRPTPAWQIRPGIRLAAFDGDYDAGSFQDADNTYTNDLILPSLSVDYTGKLWSFGGRYNYVATDRIFNSTFGTFSFFGRAHQGELFAVMDRQQGGRLTLGTQVRDESLDVEAPATAPRITTLSPYAQYQLATAGGFLADLGLRLNQHSEFGSQLNWSASAGMQTTKAWSTRLVVSSSFQSPTLDQLAGPFGANPDLQPQVATAVELTTTLADPAGKYRLTLTGFQRNIKDLIVFDSEGYQNRDEMRDRGVEIEASGLLFPTLRLGGNLTYVRGKLTNPALPGALAETETFNRRPRLSGQINLAFNPASPFFARLAGSYIGQRPDLFFDENFTPISVDLEAYFLLSAYAEYQLHKSRNLTLFAEVRNLTDTEFVEVTGFSTQGATVRGGVKIKL